MTIRMEHVNSLPIYDPLTERELEVLRLMREGLSNREIADRLVISFETVRWYTKQIYSKLGVNSRAQAIIRAGEWAEADGAAPLPAAPRDTLPTYALSFVGREAELDEIRALLSDPKVRLLTVTGLGGMGKTRLSVEAARAQRDAFPDGVYFIPLLNHSSTDDLFAAIGQEMRLPLAANRLDALRDKHALLLLDNFDHLLENAHIVADLLDAAPALKILVTSRASLNLGGEWVRTLEGVDYPLPDAAAPIEDYSAVQLFIERVHRVSGDFSLAENRDCVIEICRLTYGMPLALELASAWVKSMTCADIVREIRRSTDFLTTRQRDVDDRHRSLRAVFDCSWDLLSDQEQRVFRRLSMFRGGFGYAAAEQVAGATPQILSDLVDKSLLYQNARGMYEIHGLLHQYIEKRLESIQAGARSVRSNMIFVWASLVRGNFEKARELVENIMATRDKDKPASEEAFGLALLGVLAGIDEDYARGQQLCEASVNLLAQGSQSTDPISSVFAWLGIAIAHCGQGNYPLARRGILAALKVAAQLNAPAFMTLCLPVVSIILAHEVESEWAVELMGLAFNHPASTPTWMEGWPLLRRLRADLRAEMGDEAFAASWNHGKNANLEAIMADVRGKFE